MLHKTLGIVLRSVKYGETSLITTIFTEMFGVQAYMVQGVRSTKAKSNKTVLLQPSTLLDLVVYMNPQKNLQRLSEYQAAHLYTTLGEDIIKNTIALFSIELLLRLLPENAISTSLFQFAFQYFILLDKTPTALVANFPLFYIIQCSTLLGYELKGNYTTETPYLDIAEGGFTANTPFITNANLLSEHEIATLDYMNAMPNYETLIAQPPVLNANSRYRLLEWYINFLQQHTQHTGTINSLPILKMILH